MVTGDRAHKGVNSNEWIHNLSQAKRPSAMEKGKCLTGKLCLGYKSWWCSEEKGKNCPQAPVQSMGWREGMVDKELPHKSEDSGPTP